MRFIITGGGTGGHIYPALAIARGLEERYPGAQILYMGTEGGLEADIVGRSGFDFKPVRISGLKRAWTLKNLIVLYRAGESIVQARRVIKDFRPSAVIGTGGYVCGPVVLAAVSLRIPSFIHEQNAWPGITNRILSPFARRVMVTFEDSRERFPRRARTVLTGLPVRPEILEYSREQAREELGVQEGQRLVLSFGGSQGARSINRAMAGVLKEFRNNQRTRFLHVTGREQYDNFNDFCREEGFSWEDGDNIEVVPYLYQMPRALAAADLVVCRAGAATLAEITVRGVPCILVPYPYAAENHQEYNARALAGKSAAEMILDRELSGPVLAGKIRNILLHREVLQKMHEASIATGKPQALQDILNCIEKYAW